MKTGLIILVIGFVSIVVVLICVAAIVTSTTQGAKWLEDVGKSDSDTDTAASDLPND